MFYFESRKIICTSARTTHYSHRTVFEGVVVVGEMTNAVIRKQHYEILKRVAPLKRDFNDHATISN